MTPNPEGAAQPETQELSAEVTYKTRHIALAAYLKVKGFALLGVEDETRGPGIHRKVFVFDRGPEARKQAFDFHKSDYGLYDEEKRQLAELVYGKDQKKARKRT